MEEQYQENGSGEDIPPVHPPASRDEEDQSGGPQWLIAFARTIFINFLMLGGVVLFLSFLREFGIFTFGEPGGMGKADFKGGENNGVSENLIKACSRDHFMSFYHLTYAIRWAFMQDDVHETGQGWNL